MTDNELPPFERALAREALVSERFTVTLFAGFYAALLLSFVAVASANPDLLIRLFQGRVGRFWVVLVLAAVSAYFLFNRWLLGRAIRRGQEPSSMARYVTWFIQVSLPSAAILVNSLVIPPGDAIFVPPTFLYFLFIILATLQMNFALCAFTGAVAGAEYYALSLYLLAKPEASGLDLLMRTPPQHIVKACILLIAGVFAGLVATQLRKRFTNTWKTIEERNRVIDMFGQHVSPAVVDKLLAQKSGEISEMRHVCVMFLDIRDFTAFSEKKSPEEIVLYLNSLFDFMIDVINTHNGIINKFLGDGFMAIFGAPLSDGRDNRNAVAASLEILRRVDDMCRIGSIEPTRIGIGLHSGQAVTGHVGSSKRREYTIIGDVVNVASRIEGLNKTLHSQILISEAVWESLEKGSTPGSREEALTVRGRSEPVHVYRLA